jgi:fatty-acyl-CoA synthase
MSNEIKRTLSAYDYQLLIKHMFNAPVYYDPDQEIVYRNLKRLTYREFKERVHRIANGLKSLGIGPGDTVGVMDWDSHRYLELYFAVPMMGAVLHTINVRLSPEQILYTINHAEDDILLINKDFIPIYEAIKDNIKPVKKLVLITEEENDKLISKFDGEYETLVKHSNNYYDFPDFSENTRATTFYTTGTTGAPKGVYFSHRQLVLHSISILASGAAIATHRRMGTDMVYMPLTPMFHVHAWGYPYFMTMLGIKQVYPGRYEVPLILELIKKEGVTLTHTVPAIAQMILTAKEAESVDLSKLRLTTGGGAMTEALCKMGLDRGIDITNGDGMSETCPVVDATYLKTYMLSWPQDKQIKIRCKTGQPMPFTYIEAIDLNGKALPHDGVSTGEFVVRSPWLTQGYFKDPERSEELWKDGWLHTGDIGYIDPEGYVKITERLKDVIKTGGEWISSLQLEDIITQHEAVSEAAIIGIPDEKWEERPLAVVTIRDKYKGKVTAEELRNFFFKFVEQNVISKWAVPDRVEIVDAIPKTSVGKSDKKVIRQWYKK